MNNNTRDDYKNAIKAKYEIEKEGDFSNFFAPTSPANLRNLCWEKFISNDKKDDLNIFCSVFGFEFDISKSNHFATKTTDKFRPIVSFLKSEKEAAKFNRVELAAILVDFEPRPFKKFSEKGFVKIDKPINDFHEPSKPYEPEVFFVKNENETKSENVDERKDDSETECKDLIEEEILNQEDKFWQDEIFSNVRTPNLEENLSIRGFLNVENLPQESSKSSKRQGFIKRVRERFIRRIINKSKPTIIAIAIIFSLIATATLGTVIYVEFLKKDCMQWSGDHYDEVSCNLEVQGTGTFNSPETYDDRIINLRRIKVCDTTAFFKNNKAAVWYAKVGDSVEFFNTHGMHPENGKALRPVTHYIIDKYVKKH